MCALCRVCRVFWCSRRGGRWVAVMGRGAGWAGTGVGRVVSGRERRVMVAPWAGKGRNSPTGWATLVLLSLSLGGGFTMTKEKETKNVCMLMKIPCNSSLLLWYLEASPADVSRAERRNLKNKQWQQTSVDSQYASKLQAPGITPSTPAYYPSALLYAASRRAISSSRSPAIACAEPYSSSRHRRMISRAGFSSEMGDSLSSATIS